MNTHQYQTGQTWIKFFLLSFWLGFVSIGTAHATATDYMQWKTRQQQHDARLKQQMVVATTDHYLAKPALSVQATGDKISLNSANIEQLQQLHGVGLKKAQAIVEYRQKNGKFKSIEDIQLVKGIGPALFAKNKARLAL